MDQDQLQATFKTLDSVTGTIENHGMKALHDKMAGLVHLHYSETQRMDHVHYNKDIIKDPQHLEKAGVVVALDITTGAVVRYTDLEVIEGDQGLINYQIRPFHMPKTFSQSALNDRVYADTKKVGEIDPRNLVRIQTEYGQPIFIAFEDPNPENGSLVVYHGREKALEIVGMLKNLPEDVRPKGIYNGVNGYDSFDDVLNLGKTPGAVSGRHKHRWKSMPLRCDPG